MATGLLMLLDDIATILDDVSILTKVAVKKTAGVLGDDLALNAQQVSGVDANRELPVVWAVAKGSAVNKLILVPTALALSGFAPWAIQPLMVAGGTFLCFEGCEKLAHKFLHPSESKEHKVEHEQHVADPSIDLVAVEKSKIGGAIRTDFILSAEIIVIALGTLTASSLLMQAAVLATVAVVMTIGVYGLVAMIVKLDDLGRNLIATPRDHTASSLRISTGKTILVLAPYLMRFLSIAGTAAMFLVGGGILVHAAPWLEHIAESLHHYFHDHSFWGSSWIESLLLMGLNAIVGIVAGSIALVIVELVKRFRKKPAH